MDSKTFFLILSGVILMCACADNGDIRPGAVNMDCPSSPNCVSSLAMASDRQVPPFQLRPDYAENWEKVAAAVAGMPRTRIVTSSSTFLHAECKSAIFRFTDDLILQPNLATGKIDIRSASRVGYSDMGVNRKRVGALREKLVQAGVIAP